MKNLRSRRLLGVALVGLVLASVVLVVRDRPLARAAPHAALTPDLSGLPRARACWVEYGRHETSGQVSTAGITHALTWNITVAGLLIRHPRGDLVVDVGNSSRFASEIAEYPFIGRSWLRLLPGSSRVVATAPAALIGAGVDPDHLMVIPSHMHVDHAGGLVDLPRARVLMPREEIEFAAARRDLHVVAVAPAHARALDGRTSAIDFQPKPYETFDESADIFGDGSVVVVKLPGHTPGSVGVFVNISPTQRMFHVGDAVNVLEAVERRLTKSVIMAPTDEAPEQADRTVARIAQLHEERPEIAILPAHDRAAWSRVFGEAGRCVE